MKSFAKYLEESHKSACIMAEFDAPSTKSVLSIVDMVPNEWVYEPEGKEYTPHMTIRYGLNLDTLDQFPELMFILAYPQICEIQGLSKFDTHSDYDVLIMKLKETPKIFHVWRDYINMRFDCKEETYDEYVPHITIAYMKKGYAQQFIDAYASKAISITVNSVVVSVPNGNKLTIPLKG